MGLRWSTVPDPTIGKVQIWQHPIVTKGVWKKACVIAWDPLQTAYNITMFDGGQEFVTSKIFSADEVHLRMKGDIPADWVRYTDDEVRMYAHSYGVKD
jgi:hypothetical protein